MKAKNILLGVLTMFVLASCKKEAENKEAVEATTELKETYDVTFNITIPKDDNLQLFYTEDNSINFGEDKSVRALVKGSAAPQDVIFKLPVDVLPTQIRFDIGENAQQGSVVVNSVTMKYLNNTFTHAFGTGREELTHYFYLQESQLKYDAATATLAMLNPKGAAHDPLIWSNQLLSEEMIKLYKK